MYTVQTIGFTIWVDFAIIIGLKSICFTKIHNITMWLEVSGLIFYFLERKIKFFFWKFRELYHRANTIDDDCGGESYNTTICWLVENRK